MTLNRLPLLPVLLVALVAMLVVGVGCPHQAAEEAAATASSTPSAATPAGRSTPAAPAAAAAAPGAEVMAAEYAKCKWGGKPTVADIPAVPVKGMVNGKPFAAKAVRIERTSNGPKLGIYDKAGKKATDSLSGETGVELRWTDQLTEGKPGKIETPVGPKQGWGAPETEGATYYYPDGEVPATVHADWGCALEITEWKTATDPKDPRVIGWVKGKVAIVLNDEDPKSWVAGTFHGVYFRK